MCLWASVPLGGGLGDVLRPVQQLYGSDKKLLTELEQERLQ